MRRHSGAAVAQAQYAAHDCDRQRLPGMNRLPQSIARRVHEIVAALDAGRDPHDFRGKRLRHDRQIMSIPIGRRYRLLCRYTNGKLIPVRVVTHSAYNRQKPT